MARSTKEIEVKREELEGCLAVLGTTLVYISLVDERVRAAIKFYGHEQFLSPACEDLAAINCMVRQAQGIVRASYPQVFGGGE